MKTKLLLTTAALLSLSSLSANAIMSPPVLNEYGINVDGAVFYPFDDGVPGNVNVGAFDDILGLGTITATFNTAGTHNFDAYFDHDISLTADNEQGSVSGTAAAGQSWEIDSSPWAGAGNIDLNMEASALDNLNQAWVPDDIAMAMGWDFTLANGQTAEIILELIGFDLLVEVPVVPAGLSLVQNNIVNGVSNYDIYLTSTLSVTGCGITIDCTGGGNGGGNGNGNGTVPEPSIMMLMSLGLAGIVVSRRKLRV